MPNWCDPRIHSLEGQSPKPIGPHPASSPIGIPQVSAGKLERNLASPPRHPKYPIPTPRRMAPEMTSMSDRKLRRRVAVRAGPTASGSPREEENENASCGGMSRPVASRSLHLGVVRPSPADLPLVSIRTLARPRPFRPDRFGKPVMPLRRLSILVCLALFSTGCTSTWWKPEQLYRLNRGPASMNEEAYYSIPAAPPAFAAVPANALADETDVPDQFSSGRGSALRPAPSR